MDTLLQDFRFGLRGLLKHPTLTLVAVASLGLGIGANTTVFAWMDRFVLRPLPAVERFDRLVAVHTRAPDGDEWSVSWSDYRDWRDAVETTHLAAFDLMVLGLRTAEGSQRVWGNLVSGDYFDALGVPAALGRTLRRADEDAAAPVAVLGHSFWQRQFAGDSGIIGRSIVLSGQALTVVGIAAPRFGGSYVGLVFDLYVPATIAGLLGRGPELLTNRDWQTFDVVGRLRAGVTLAQARQELDRVARRTREAVGAEVRGALVKPSGDQGATEIFKPLTVALLGVTALVLLVACANVANLLLARGIARRREIAIRLSLGASRTRLVRQLLTESVALAALAGLAGLGVATWARDLMYAFVPPAPFPIAFSFETSGGTLAFAFAATAVAVLAFGLAPALVASKPDLVPTLKDDVGAGVPHRARLQPVLVAGQIALSLVSLVCAGLFLRSLAAAGRVDVGFTAPERVLLVTTDFQLAGVPDSAGAAFAGRLLERLAALPGVEAASLATMVPLGFGGSNSNGTRIEGYTPQPDENLSIQYSLVGPDYFRAMGIPIVRGRPIGTEDGRETAPVVIVNETFARRYWPGLDAIGRRLAQGGDWMTVVGVAKDGRYGQLNEAARPLVYRPFAQHYRDAFTIHVRAAAGDPRLLTPALRRAFAQTSADLPVLDLRTMAEHMEAAVFAQRMGAWMLSGFGLMALLLSAVGVYGVMSYAVSQRTREIGVRVALGAGRRTVVRLVVGRAMRLAGIGLAVGLVAALGAGRLLRTQLLGVSPSDPVTFVAIGLLLGGVALLASWIPARRAAKVDPMVALRYE